MRFRAAFWPILAIYIAARILQVYPAVPMLAVVALHVLPPAVFALLHGARIYRWRGIAVFILICTAAGNLFENLGVGTGFPFGTYHFTDLMGPKIFAVPVLLGLAYIGMAYLSWTLAWVIFGDPQSPVGGSRVVTLPLAAAAIMVSWDLSQDPVWSTVLHAWVFPFGGSYFGVPISNFLGWYLTVYVIYQSFALYLRGRSTDAQPLPPGYWREALSFYTVSAAGNLLLVLPRPGIPAVVFAGGTPWNVRGITAACAVVTLLTMGTLSLLGWVRLPARSPSVNLRQGRAYQQGREEWNK